MVRAMGEPRGPRRPARHVRHVVGLGAAAILLAGCSGDSGPSPTVASPATSTAQSPTSTSTTSSTATSRRAEVEAAVRDYYEAMERAVATGDTEEFKRSSSDRCNCRDLVDTVERVFRDGSTENVQLSVSRVSIVSVNNRSALVDTAYSTRAYRVLRDGEAPVDVPRRDARESLTLVDDGSSWKIDNALDLDR
jgi:hypothetical protein